MTRDRGKRDRFHSRQLDWLRGRTHHAITTLNVATIDKLLHTMTTVVDVRGATWIGAAELARRMELSETWVRMLLRRACAERLIQKVQRGGGCHRTSVYLLKVGAWRDDPRDPHMQAAFAERTRATLRDWFAWLEGLFIAHHQHSARCWRFAPAYLKQPPLPEAAAP